MFDSNQLNTVFRSHDAAQLPGVIGNDGLRHPEIARRFVADLRQSSSLAIQIENPAAEARRDQLIQKCRDLLSTCPDSAVIQDFEDHVQDAAIVERGYREIFLSIRLSDIWKRSQVEQAWGMVIRAERELAHVQGEIDKELAKLAAEKHPSLDPQQLRIQSEDGNQVRPDAVINGIAKNAGDTLIMLGYAHGWFDKASGVLTLPPEVKVNEEIAYQAGVFSLVASQWRCLENAWDRSRFFGARFRLREQDFPVKQGGTRRCFVLEVSEATMLELKDRIALRRLEQIFFQRQKEMDARLENAEGVPQVAGPVPLLSAGYLSPEERVTAGVLDGHYCVPVDDDAVVIAGLPMKVWLRGYAYFAEKGKDDAGKPVFACPRISEGDLIKGLVNAGLSNEQAKTFIELTTFGRNTADLFDAPLLKVSDGSYCFFAPAYHAPTLGVILLSRISSLNRRRDAQGEPANDASFEDKGKLFENRILKLFAEAKIPARGFKYKVDGVEYDCDVAALMDEVLFVFECKNRSLPMGHLPSLNYFSYGLDESEAQAKRIAQQFTDHPEIVTVQFGANAKWKRIVPVVLHALPWSFGCPNGVYIYDASALSRFLNDGFVSLIAESKLGIHTVLRRHRYQLWKGKRPTAAELEREMGNPNQLRLQALGWEQIAQPVQISENFVFSLPEWKQHPSTLEEKMIALGSSKEEAARRAKEFDDEYPEALEKLRGKIKERQGRVKIGRNEPCPCGSGKKYKKCCLGKSPG